MFNEIIVSEQVVNKTSIEAGYIFGIFKEVSFQKADEEGWFRLTTDELEVFTKLSFFKQKARIDELIELGIVKQENRGMPQRRYFKIVKK